MIDPQELIGTCYKLVPSGVNADPYAGRYAARHQHRILRLIPYLGCIQRRTDCRATTVQHIILRLGTGLPAPRPRQGQEQPARSPRYAVARRSKLRSRLHRIARPAPERRLQPQHFNWFSRTPSTSSDRPRTAIRDFAQLTQEERRLLAAQSMFDRR